MRQLAKTLMVIATLLLSGTAWGQLKLQVDMLKEELVLGEPAYLRLTISNEGQQPQKVFPLWVWNSRWVKKKLPLPCYLEKLGDRQWQEVARGKWSRPIDGKYGGSHTSLPPPVLLEAGESFEIWWDIGWHYSLTEGQYRVRVELKVGEQLQAGKELTSEPIAFQVRAQEERTRGAWEKYALMEEKAEHGSRYWWLMEADLADLEDTPYFPWAVYLRVEHTIAFFTTSGYFVSLRQLEEAISDRYADFPLRHRLEIYWRFRKAFPADDLPRDLYDTALKALAEQYPVGSKEWWRRGRQLLAELVEWQDLEWASLMSECMAHKAAFYCFPKIGRDPCEQWLKAVLGDRYPWWRLPKAQRPSKDKLLKGLDN